MSLALGDEVPNIFTRKSRLQPLEFLNTGAKRLLQHNPPKTGHGRRGKIDAIDPEAVIRVQAPWLRAARERRVLILSKYTAHHLQCRRDAVGAASFST